MEDNLRWKTTFNGRQTSMEDNLEWKMTLHGRQPSMEDNLWWQSTFDGRWPWMEDNLRLKTNFKGRWCPMMEDDLEWKTTFDGRWSLTPSVSLSSCHFFSISLWRFLESRHSNREKLKLLRKQCILFLYGGGKGATLCPFARLGKGVGGREVI